LTTRRSPSRAPWRFKNSGPRLVHVTTHSQRKNCRWKRIRYDWDVCWYHTYVPRLWKGMLTSNYTYLGRSKKEENQKSARERCCYPLLLNKHHTRNKSYFP
jgi:hypothetical protein